MTKSPGKVDRDLKRLVARYPGFSLRPHGKGWEIAAATGETLPLAGANRMHHVALTKVEQWLRRRANQARTASRQQAKYHDDGEGANSSGSGMAVSRRRASQKHLRQMHETWAKLAPDDQVAFVAEVLVLLSEREPRFLRARQEIGV